MLLPVNRSSYCDINQVQYTINLRNTHYFAIITVWLVSITRSGSLNWKTNLALYNYSENHSENCKKILVDENYMNVLYNMWSVYSIYKRLTSLSNDDNQSKLCRNGFSACSLGNTNINIQYSITVTNENISSPVHTVTNWHWYTVYSFPFLSSLFNISHKIIFYYKIYY